MNKFITHLHRQNIVLSWQRYGIDTLNGMALGLFGSLIVGVILKNLGNWTSLEVLINIGTHAQTAVGGAVGVGVAYGLKAPPLVLFSAVAVGLAGAELGGVVGSLLAVAVGVEVGKFVHKTTPIDIIITPIITLMVGIGTAYALAPLIVSVMASTGELITWAMNLSPIVMSVVVAVVMGMLLTLPISSLAIAVSLGLSGVVAGASTVGCACQMIGFAVMSYKDNGVGGAVACGLGTSMIQMPNIAKNPKIWLPPTLTGAILAPIATVGFDMQNIAVGAGMGTSGLVGQVGTLDAMGVSGQVVGLIVLFHFILPAILTLIFYHCFKKLGWIRAGDLKLEN